MEGSTPRVIFFDLETTGYRGCNKYADKHRIIQFAALETERRMEFSKYVDPQIEILQRSTKCHGITDAVVAGAPSLGEVWNEFCDRFAIGDSSTQVILVAHNSHAFDRIVLLKELERQNIEPRYFEHVVFGDSLLHFRHLACSELQAQLKASTAKRSKYNLANLYKFFVGESMLNAHDARADVKALVAVCEAANIDWTSFPWLASMNTRTDKWYYPAPSMDADIVLLHGIGPARRNAIARALEFDFRSQALSISIIRACLGDDVSPLEAETFLREEANFDDDALIVELLSYLCHSNPLELIAGGFPFVRNYWGDLSIGGHIQDTVEENARTIQELVEAMLYDSELKSLVLSYGVNQHVLPKYSFRLKVK